MEIMVMKITQVNPLFWCGKNVFLTGHTGFKGGWLCLWLASMGANVTGYALPPKTTPNIFDVLDINNLITKSYFSDIRNLDVLKNAMKVANPDVIIHMAAQPLVRYSYINPVETYETNVMGTVHLLEAARSINTVKATIVVTTDKCYENRDWAWGYRETDPLGGYDPYSNSKGCAELVVSAYRQSFFQISGSSNNLATVRAGNVIGGGDWSEDRLIPDAIKSFDLGQVLKLRNPLATRPWQHVLEPLSGYLTLTQALFNEGIAFASAWNFGPRDEDNRSVENVIDLLISQWDSKASWEIEASAQPHEANLLKLDCSKAYSELGWNPRWNIEIAVQKIIEWHKAWRLSKDMRELSLAQIKQYMNV
jgi:CDP-glucose 4,6-dehydratase